MQAMSRRAAIVSLASAASFALGSRASFAAELDAYFKTSNRAAATVIDHSAWNALLGKYIVRSADGINRFAYVKVASADRQALQMYLRALQAVKIAALKSDEQRAFWINLYNALTIDIVLEHYPVKSIRDISLGGGLFTTGPWSKPLVSVEGRELSLDNIEHDILRKLWHDPRVHYSVNCASLGCPNLMPIAFTGVALDAMLTQGARDYINHPRGVRINGQTVQLSKIYYWYREDFGASDAAVLSHLKQFAGPALKTALESVQSIAGYDYDWSINDAA